MFHSIKVSVTLGAAVLIAAPGCCLPNLLCNHSSPSEETVVAGYSSEYVGDYSALLIVAVVARQDVVLEWLTLERTMPVRVSL